MLGKNEYMYELVVQTVGAKSSCPSAVKTFVRQSQNVFCLGAYVINVGSTRCYFQTNMFKGGC